MIHKKSDTYILLPDHECTQCVLQVIQVTARQPINGWSMQRSLARWGHLICPSLLHRARACQRHSWPAQRAVPTPIASVAIFTRALLGVVVLVCTGGGPCDVVVVHVFHGDLIVHRLEVASALASFHSSSRWPHYLSTIFLLIFVARLVSWSTLFSCCLI